MKILLLLLFLSTQSFAVIYVTPDSPKTNVGAYVLIDSKSGKLLAEKNAHSKMPPASLTKLMTSYIVFNKIREKVVSLDDKVNISQKAFRMRGSRSFLNVGKKIRLEDLIKGMIIQSGNDSAVALAEHIAGSENTFVDLMNRYAQAIGMHDTHFSNSSGLPDEKHYSTAFDLALLSKKIINEFPEFYKWYGQKKFKFNGIEQRNRNRLLWIDNSVDGLKTGHTEKAGYCLVSSAKRIGMRLISVVLNAKSNKARTKETQKILDYGFRFFETQSVGKKDETLAKVDVYKGEKDKVAVGLATQEYITVARGRFKELVFKLKLNGTISAPIKKHQPIGNLEIYLGNNLIKTYPLVTLESIKNGSFFGNIIDSIKLIF
ncbi:D-alanyl-D-alanine carboxypeptidase [hydrothermal vent metagenome]|uniref:serine-type D-Ala-D-Ala carboxypeptidase n=1 Tax=hydrothermal vent metagenome TaxID=652676 RepID=A0A1W1CDZ6_9ZZZZ